MSVNKVVVLARGLGTRMQRKANGLKLERQIEDVADIGWKPFIPLFGTKSFIDCSIEILRKVGFKEVCIVIGPEHIPIIEHFERSNIDVSDFKIVFAIQQEPQGTADAVRAAKEFVGSDSFVVINGDNLYPPSCFKMLIAEQREICYVVGFNRDDLILRSNYSAERVKKFAVIEADNKGALQRIIEKPSDPEAYRTSEGILVNMNLFRFTPRIFWACERIAPHHTRGEYELPSAVQLLVNERVIPVKVLIGKECVLDLTYRTDIPMVRSRLREWNKF